MVYYFWSWEFLADCAEKLAIIEKKLTSEQLKYLREYYTINRYPDLMETEEMAKQWNIDNFDFHMGLMNWFFCKRMAEEEVAQRQYEATKAAA